MHPQVEFLCWPSGGECTLGHRAPGEGQGQGVSESPSTSLSAHCRHVQEHQPHLPRHLAPRFRKRLLPLSKESLPAWPLSIPERQCFMLQNYLHLKIIYFWNCSLKFTLVIQCPIWSQGCIHLLGIRQWHTAAGAAEIAEMSHLIVVEQASPRAGGWQGLVFSVFGLLPATFSLSPCMLSSQGRPLF